MSDALIAGQAKFENGENCQDFGLGRGGRAANNSYGKSSNVKKVIAYYWRPERVRTLERVKNLERFSLYQVNQGDLAHITLEIKKMGHLKSLDISVDKDVTWTPSLLPEKALEGPVKLRVLRVMECAHRAWNINSTGPIFDWLCSPVFDHSEVQMLSWKYTIRDRGLAGIETERLRYLFNSLSPQLESLVLTLPGDWSDSNSGKLKLDPLCSELLFFGHVRWEGSSKDSAYDRLLTRIGGSTI
ncbi:hypothetical protein K435DRAFT_809167 [Dendrothele bispora CBS 962.96]|uniref:Uncharacterized protein n=1 Tax=Dendrothele bispora (strain CBS 962.96) TaxID=1314807 RepID=A0A4S8KZ59_DENBC|nr:hypothetical protein K435DRAFT_809167 [Dendrothele bispora CBS 962.96]